MNSQEIVSSRAEGSLLGSRAISSHLQELYTCLKEKYYPEKSLKSMSKCGTKTGQFIVKQCNCEAKLIPLKHHCNLRTCSECSNIRKRRIKRSYLPILNHYSVNPRDLYSLYFLTISPAHFPSLREALNHIKKSFSKFTRLDYIEKRIKGGIWVIETKETGQGFHVHIHAIIYTRRLDNQIRGHCLTCGQNLIKKNYLSMKYYCANKRCLSENVTVTIDSKLVTLWKKCSNHDVNINITHLDSSEHCLNYMLKYISANKDDFSSTDYLAEYILVSYKQKLIMKFGVFHGLNFNEKQPCICPKCKFQVYFLYDPIYTSYIPAEEQLNSHSYFPPPPLLLSDYDL